MFIKDNRIDNPLRNQEIEDICDRLKAAWLQNPCLRLGQLIEIITNDSNMGIFTINDTEIVSKIEQFIKQD